MSQQTQTQLPSRDAAASYLRKKPVASTLDMIVTELLVQQPEDPERHLFEILQKRQIEKQQQQNSNSISPGASRHPIPPMTRDASTGKEFVRGNNRRHSDGGNMANAAAAAAAAASDGLLSSAGNTSATFTGSNNNDADSLLYFLLDYCAPQPNSSNENNNESSTSATSSSSSNNNNKGDGTSGVMHRANSNMPKRSSGNEPPRLPAGTEQHPLAMRALALATRYHFVGNASNISSSEAADINKGDSSPSAFSRMTSGGAGGGVTAESSGSESPSVLTPAVLSHLKSSFNLTEADHRHLILAVTDAMQIILDWAGDPLLVAENLAGVVKLLVNGDRCTVFVADERAQTLRTVIEGKPITVKFGQGIVGRCAVQKQPLVVNNAYSHPGFNPSVDSEVNYVTRNLLSMPMLVEGQLIAVVQVLNKSDGDFGDFDVEIFKAFTAVAGIVVRDAMTFPLTLRNCELAEATKDLCTELMCANLLDQRECCTQWAARLRGFLGADSCSMLRVMCYDPETARMSIHPDQLEMTFLAADSDIDFGGFQPLPQKQIIASAITTRKPELVNDAKSDLRFDHQAARLLTGSGIQTSSILIVPVFPFTDAESAAGNRLFTCYVLQFENFRETGARPLSAESSRESEDREELHPHVQFRSLSSSGNLGGSPNRRGSTATSSQDIIFSDEAIEHVNRILPFFEVLVRHSQLVLAQKQQSNLLRETSRTVTTLCEDRLEFSDMFDMLSKTIEHLIQRDKRTASVLFYTKFDSEGIDMLQLLPRASLIHGSKETTETNVKSTGPRATGGQSFRLRRRGSLANLQMSTTDIKIPIGSGVVGTCVSRAGSSANYYTAEETNDLYMEGEFGPLVDRGCLPNCPCLVVPLFDSQMLLGAIVILKPRDDIRERLLLSGAENAVAQSATMSNLHSNFFSSSINTASGAGGGGGNMNNNNNANNNPGVNMSAATAAAAGGGGLSGAGHSSFSSSSPSSHVTPFSPISIENLNWMSVIPDKLHQAARVDFLSVLISVSKYVFKASNTITALARQQEGILFSGELERLAMPVSQKPPTSAGSTSGETLTGLDPSQSTRSNNNEVGTPSNAGGTGSGGGGSVSAAAAGESSTTSAATSAAGGGTSSPMRVLSAQNMSQFAFGGKKSASPLDTPLRPEMFDLLTTTRFPIFEFIDGNQPATGLVPLTVHMFRSLNCLPQLGVDESTLSVTLIKAFRRYRDVPYHNVFHAFDVTQSVFLFMRMAKLDEAFTPAERFALLISAVFHDIDHNGLNNAYHMKAETAFGMIASLSGQKSVLEYHHCQVAIDVINSCGLLNKTSEEDRRRILKIFFQTILATDMAVHREIMQQMQSQFLGEDGTTRTFESTNSDHRDLLAKQLLKMADISNPVKDFGIARRWGLSVTEEFYRQGDVERSEGHDVAPMFDRQLNAELSKGQIGFISFMAAPFFNLCAKCFPEYLELTGNMESNLARWTKVQQSADAEKAAAAEKRKQEEKEKREGSRDNSPVEEIKGIELNTL